MMRALPLKSAITLEKEALSAQKPIANLVILFPSVAVLNILAKIVYSDSENDWITRIIQ